MQKSSLRLIPSVSAVIALLASCCTLGSFGCKTEQSGGSQKLPEAVTTAAQKAPAEKIATLSDFTQSAFCQKYHCVEDRQWQLRNGETNHSFNTDLTEADAEVETDAAGQVSGMGLDLSDRDELTDIDWDSMNAFLTSTDQSLDHGNALEFAKRHVIQPVCYECSVVDARESVRDGDFQVKAGRSGSDEVITLQRLATFRKASELTSLRVGESLFRVGDLADSILPSLKQYELGEPENERIRHTPGWIAVHHLFLVGGAGYDFEFRETRGAGPYRLFLIKDEGRD